jgi:hypothetical protein
MWPGRRGRHKPCPLLPPPDRRGLPERVQVTALEGETAARKTVISSFASWTGEACSPLARTNREMHYGIGHANRYSASMLRLDSWRSTPRPFHAAGLVSFKQNVDSEQHTFSNPSRRAASSSGVNGRRFLLRFFSNRSYVSGNSALARPEERWVFALGYSCLYDWGKYVLNLLQSQNEHPKGGKYNMMCVDLFELAYLSFRSTGVLSSANVKAGSSRMAFQLPTPCFKGELHKVSKHLTG